MDFYFLFDDFNCPKHFLCDVCVSFKPVISGSSLKYVRARDLKKKQCFEKRFQKIIFIYL